MLWFDMTWHVVMIMMLGVNISDIAIINIKGVDYRCIIYGISKSEAINLLANYVLEERGMYKYSYQRNQYQKSSLGLFWQFNQSKKIRN